MEFPRFLLQGDTGLVVEFAADISPVILAAVHSLQKALSDQPPVGVLELVPTYRSLLVVYDPGLTSPELLTKAIAKLLPRQVPPLPQGEVVQIPVCYDLSLGWDLQQLSEMVGLTIPEVIAEHSSSNYLTYMLGFTPGFPYLGGLSPRIACPRLATPRTLVPAGSVGIAEEQTGIYPLDSPGGWRIIGRTPLKLFDPSLEQPFLLKAGNYLRFVPISLEEYQRLSVGR
ncbi:MAG: 5-oxoprolinase subunit PxpB [Symbiobacteriaceae bacterium]|nr:5-oxoprolinase subunit PxpB [Symbiobacteriaceae bacterium]